MSAAHLRIGAGGTPTPRELAALTAAAQELIAAERAAPADPTPPAYRSRWRRAALVELTEVPASIKDDGRPWGGRA